MKQRSRILALCGFASLVVATSRADDVDAMYAKLQGEWNSISYEASRTAKDSRKVTLIFKGKKVTVKCDGQTEESDVGLDLEAEPKQLDIIEYGGVEIFKISKGIFKLQGDTLTICHGGIDRPVRFEIRPKDYAVDSLIVLRRK